MLKFAVLCLLFTVSLLSCSKSSSNENERAEEAMNANNKEEIKEEIKLDFVLLKYDDDHIPTDIAPKVNGNYIFFDNDADYQELCRPVWFYKKCVHYLFREYGGYNQPISSELKELLKELPNAINICLNGNKGNIKDERIRKLIDMAWYDLHPNNNYFYLQDNSYDYKLYYGNPHGSVVCTHYKGDIYYDLDGNKLPKDVLVIDTY